MYLFNKLDNTVMTSPKNQLNEESEPDLQLTITNKFQSNQSNIPSQSNQNSQKKGENTPKNNLNNNSQLNAHVIKL